MKLDLIDSEELESFIIIIENNCHCIFSATFFKKRIIAQIIYITFVYKKKLFS